MKIGNWFLFGKKNVKIIERWNLIKFWKTTHRDIENISMAQGRKGWFECMGWLDGSETMVSRLSSYEVWDETESSRGSNPRWVEWCLMRKWKERKGREMIKTASKTWETTGEQCKTMKNESGQWWVIKLCVSFTGEVQDSNLSIYTYSATVLVPKFENKIKYFGEDETS